MPVKKKKAKKQNLKKKIKKIQQKSAKKNIKKSHNQREKKKKILIKKADVKNQTIRTKEKTNPKKEEITKEVKINPPRLQKINLSRNLEELFFQIKDLNNDEMKDLIKVYKPSAKNEDSDKINLILKLPRNPGEILMGFKDEIKSRLLDKYDLIKSAISQRRKNGEDLILEDLSSQSIPLKINLFCATSDEKDLQKVKSLILSLQSKLKLKTA